MAGDWIKFEKSTLDKPEVFEMAGILQIDPDAVIGKLLRVWDWFDDQSIDGYAPVTLAAQLNRNTGCADFTLAMQKVGWLEVEGDRLKVPNFSRHNGQTAKDRALSAKRMAKSRAKSYGDSVTNTATKTQPEKRREEKNKKLKPTQSEIVEFVKSIDLPESDGIATFQKWEGNGWMNGGQKIKNWKMTIQSWKTAGYMPSQKSQPPNGSATKPKFTRNRIDEQIEIPDL